MTQTPEPYRYIDRHGDEMYIGSYLTKTGEVLAFETDDTIHVPLADVEQVVDAIRAQARQVLGTTEQPAVPQPEPLPAAFARTEQCIPVTVDGETIRLRGSGDLTDQDRQFAAEIVRAAKRQYAAEYPAPTVTEAQPAPDTLAAWLHQRFTPAGVTDWDHLDADDRSYWEHHARAVRRAVARGGFNGMDPRRLLGIDSPAAPVVTEEPK